VLLTVVSFWQKERTAPRQGIELDSATPSHLGHFFSIFGQQQKTAFHGADYKTLFIITITVNWRSFSPVFQIFLMFFYTTFEMTIFCEGLVWYTTFPSLWQWHLLKWLQIELECSLCFLLNIGTAKNSRALLGDYCLSIGRLPEPKASVVETILNVLTVLKPYWKFLRLQEEFDAADPEKSGGEHHRPVVEFRGDEVEKDNQVSILFNFFPCY
jgi:hypothetical protein